MKMATCQFDGKFMIKMKKVPPLHGIELQLPARDASVLTTRLARLGCRNGVFHDF